MATEIKVPKRHCEGRTHICPFFTWTGYGEQDFCGLYGQFTENDNQYPVKRKPEFCKAVKVKIEEVGDASDA